MRGECSSCPTKGKGCGSQSSVYTHCTLQWRSERTTGRVYVRDCLVLDSSLDRNRGRERESVERIELLSSVCCVLYSHIAHSRVWRTSKHEERERDFFSLFPQFYLSLFPFLLTIRLPACLPVRLRPIGGLERIGGGTVLWRARLLTTNHQQKPQRSAVAAAPLGFCVNINTIKPLVYECHVYCYFDSGGGDGGGCGGVVFTRDKSQQRPQKQQQQQQQLHDCFLPLVRLLHPSFYPPSFSPLFY